MANRKTDMESNELISVIMPAYNAEKTLARAAESVLAQTYPHLELIIIDDCSKDGTASLAEGYARLDSRVRLLRNETNRGVSLTRHRGVEAAGGKWLAFLDSDDAWMHNKLEKQLPVQKKNNAKLVFTGSAFMDADGNPFDWTMHVPAQVGYRQLLKKNFISNSSVLILKACYLEFEAIGDSMHEDFTCWLKFLRTGETAYGIDEPLLIYRVSPTSKSGNRFRAVKMTWNSYRAINMHVIEAGYYLIWHMFNGMRKFRHLRG